MQLERLKKFEILNREDLKIFQGGFVAVSTVESTSSDSDCVSRKKGDNCI